jgi:hypothetical protein
MTAAKPNFTVERAALRLECWSLVVLLKRLGLWAEPSKED